MPLSLSLGRLEMRQEVSRVFSFTLPASADADPVGSRQVLLGPPHRKRKRPIPRSLDERTEWGGFG